jgi:hypothetical protein
MMRLNNGIRDRDLPVRTPIVTRENFDFRIFSASDFRMLDEVQRSSPGYSGKFGRGEPNIPMPDKDEKFNMYQKLSLTIDRLEKIDPNRIANLNNLLSIMNFDTMESNISEDMAKKLRKIICNEPR